MIISHLLKAGNDGAGFPQFQAVPTPAGLLQDRGASRPCDLFNHSTAWTDWPNFRMLWPAISIPLGKLSFLLHFQ